MRPSNSVLIIRPLTVSGRLVGQRRQVRETTLPPTHLEIDPQIDKIIQIEGFEAWDPSHEKERDKNMPKVEIESF